MDKVSLNNISPAEGSKKRKRIVGRGAGSGLGKTCGKGHKGQKSRSGGKIRAGFEGGQMPLQMRLPKFGFNSRLASITANIRLSELKKCKTEEINLQALIDAGIVQKNIKKAKIYLSGEINKAYNISGIKLTKGAEEAITKLGGKINLEG